MTDIFDKALEVARNQQQQNQSLPQPSLSVPVNSSPVHTLDDKLELNSALGACLVVQRTYGKQGADLPATIKIFLHDLKEYPMNQIVDAVNKWRRVSQEFPTPADIISILNPAPKFDYAVYSALIEKKKRGELGEFSKGWDYIKAYEKNAMEGL